MVVKEPGGMGLFEECKIKNSMFLAENTFNYFLFTDTFDINIVHEGHVVSYQTLGSMELYGLSDIIMSAGLGYILRATTSPLVIQNQI